LRKFIISVENKLCFGNFMKKGNETTVIT